MIPGKASRVAELVKAAVDQPPEKRRSFVARACGDDPEVQREVESLLGFLEPASGFIEGSAVELEASAMAAESDVRAEQRFGDYRLLSRIGAGGMGDVYLAEDTKLQRKVALKFVRAALGSAEMVARFRREEQILASLNHPNIAQLYGGAVSHEMPFFVMEYVEGLRIDEYCHVQRAATGERLQLFRKVCAAVHYAHQHLVVHRDLKPSNILVTEAGEPKLLDFGIAKVARCDGPAADRGAGADRQS